jgi:hypothetical protein
MPSKSIYLLALFSAPAIAGVVDTLPDYATKLDPTCAVSMDRFETASRINRESMLFADKCVETEKFRPVVDVKIEGTELTFANFYLNRPIFRFHNYLLRV